MQPLEPSSAQSAWSTRSARSAWSTWRARSAWSTAALALAGLAELAHQQKQSLTRLVVNRLKGYSTKFHNSKFQAGQQICFFPLHGVSSCYLSALWGSFSCNDNKCASAGERFLLCYKQTSLRVRDLQCIFWNIHTVISSSTPHSVCVSTNWVISMDLIWGWRA